ncbi:hypothetical protein AMAG_12718 [Allomyces macrogynus ATCC 38327]|uniref:Yeast cell wall synthesis Kre9/Knh1-like N-terminal domain-containing protein n=1 Tax=Allomyces macrogynus (strain ATCC 38327) TaxID=578462 RepID=A0A0L0T1V0_ALLM3|nr:hypothetical protein AMAG_12718 [Allomyces macrogynus ATCC 38327]|eukprot:KNE68549.1 hypothetical protein AMAG_12718 [Allomyces macrogynus ATCC 38327]
MRAAALILLVLAVLATAVSATTFNKRQLIKDTCTNDLEVTSPTDKDTWKAGTKVTASWNKPPGKDYSPMSVQVMQANQSDPMLSNRIMLKSLGSLGDAVDPTSNKVEATLPTDLPAGGDYFVRISYAKKDDANAETKYTCSPYFKMLAADKSGASRRQGEMATAGTLLVAGAAAIVAVLFA